MTDVTSSKKRPKLLWLTRNLPPLVGGMERFNERLLAELSREFDIVVCGPTGCSSSLPFALCVVEIPVQPLPLFMVRIQWAAAKLARKFRPAVIIAGSGLTAPFALLAARFASAKVLVFLYGLDLAVKNWVYRCLWIRSICACDRFIAISEYTNKLALQCGVDGSRGAIINPGIDFPLPHHVDHGTFRHRHYLESAKILLSVGRLTRRKGLAEFVREALPSLVARDPRIVLVVIGGEPGLALAGNRGGGADSIRQSAREVGLEAHVRLLGHVTDMEVAEAYADGDVHVFPGIEIPGDVEGFGLVALDAAAAGIPTVAFRVGGVPDAVREGVSGALLSAGDYVGLVAAIDRFLLAPWAESERRACIEHAATFSWSVVGRRVSEVVASLADKPSNGNAKGAAHGGQ